MLRLRITSDDLAGSAGKVSPCLGVFDSGIGGLAVVSRILSELPDLPLLYIADQVNAPYGIRPFQEVEKFAFAITQELARQGAIVVGLACNTASAAALYSLRQAFCRLEIVGMEPAVKPAARNTRTGKIGVIATENTLHGEPYAGVMARFAADLEVHALPCPEFVELVECGDVDSADAWITIKNKLEPLLAAGIDQLVLGCTHYSFLKPLIEKACCGRAAVVDPTQAVADQTLRVWRRTYHPADKPQPSGGLRSRFITTADTESRKNLFQESVRHFVNESAEIEQGAWLD